MHFVYIKIIYPKSIQGIFRNISLIEKNIIDNIIKKNIIKNI